MQSRAETDIRYCHGIVVNARDDIGAVVLEIVGLALDAAMAGNDAAYKPVASSFVKFRRFMVSFIVVTSILRVVYQFRADDQVMVAARAPIPLAQNGRPLSALEVDQAPASPRSWSDP